MPLKHILHCGRLPKRQIVTDIIFDRINIRQMEEIEYKICKLKNVFADVKTTIEKIVEIKNTIKRNLA